jgi:Zn-dependent M28 family amino/carboxypeptidase
MLLELARALRSEPGVLLAATGAEERVETGSPIHLGSQRLLRGLGRSVRLAVALDMIGYGPMLTVRGIEREPNRSAAALLDAARKTGVRAFYLRDRGESDHAELTRGGVPAAWVEWREDPCWHRACDRYRRVDPARMRAAGELVLAAARPALAG